MKKKKSLAEVYHQETKYIRSDLMRDTRQLDWASQPTPFKEIHSDRKVELVHYLPFSKNPFTGEGLNPVPEELGGGTLAQISRLLYFTNGVTGMLEFAPGNVQYYRAAPSAGALYPTELYIAVRDLPSLENGIYNFQVKDHSLIPLWEGDFWKEFKEYGFGHEVIDRAQLLIIFTAVFHRSSWRYQERAYRRILLDTGHILGNLNCYAFKEGFGVYPISGFFDAALNHLLLLDEEKEGTLMLVALPRFENLFGTEIRRSSVYPSEKKNEANGLPGEGLLGQLHRASYIGKGTFEEGELPDDQLLEEKYRDRPRTPLTAYPLEWKKDIEKIIMNRRSTRVLSGEPFLKDELSSILTFAYEPAVIKNAEGATGRGLPQVFDPSLLETYLVVHGVVEMDPGIYYYAPGSQELRLIQKGDFRQQTLEFCLGQELGRDAAVVFIHTSDLNAAVQKYGDRAYRYLHLDAGHIGQRLNLAAVHLGLGASGIGGFFDDEVNKLLQINPEQIVVYITTLGRAQQRAIKVE
ncbi:MAG TPA: SagB/ThcOx family dehydrogenase [Nitrospiria bacterium]|jgi:SagB-type dehydrogenase family enzyme